MKKLTAIITVLMLLTGAVWAKSVKIGILIDETGATGDVGKPYGEGVRDAVRWFNENGGIDGQEIEILYVDYGYKIPVALSTYKKFMREKVVAIHGWGTGDTENLVKLVTKDKIPYFSGSYSEHITDPKTAPYNFIVGATYSDQTRAALKYIKENGEKKTVAFIYNDSSFGRSPFFPDGEDKAKELGLSLVDTQVVDLKALDATSQLLNMNKKNPEFAIIQETYMATSTILKDAKKLNVPTQFIGLNWTFGKKLVEMAGDDTEGFMGTNAYALWNDPDSEGIKFLHELNKKYHPEVTYRNVNYIQGFVSMYVMVNALKMAKGDYRGENLKKTLESMRNFDTMGITAPVSFTPESHKGLRALRIYQIQKGELKPVTNYISAE
jgi:branched-chain amino acid transport system substrate-binding protein